MVDHNNSPFLIWKNITMSESVEMYLVSIARIAESIGDESVPIPALAEVMNILPVSTNQMIRKLEETGLVHYLPYKGVQLTEAGQVIAEQVRRQHQLWEVFLVEYLKFPPQTADSLACRFEHIMSDAEVEHLAAFLAASGAAEFCRGAAFTSSRHRSESRVSTGTDDGRSKRLRDQGDW